MLQQLLMNTYLIWGNKNTTPFCIYGTYYTTNLDNIINEVSMQKQNALNILNNKAKFEAVVSECDNILGLINNRSESPRNPAPDFEEFKLSMNERLTNQETLLLRIAQELGLDKPKQ